MNSSELLILNSRPGGSREVLVSVSESGFPFYSILLTVAMFLCSFNCFNLFLPKNKALKTDRLGLLSPLRNIYMTTHREVIVSNQSALLLAVHWQVTSPVHGEVEAARLMRLCRLI